MLKREMAMFVLAMGTMVTACGGVEEKGLFGTTVRGGDPSCGNNCPETCWVDFSTAGMTQTATFYVFDADELPETPLRNAELALEYGENQWSDEIGAEVNDPVQVMVEGQRAVPNTFDVTDTGLAAMIVLGIPEEPLECGYKVD